MLKINEFREIPSKTKTNSDGTPKLYKVAVITDTNQQAITVKKSAQGMPIVGVPYAFALPQGVEVGQEFEGELEWNAETSRYDMLVAVGEPALTDAITE